MIENPRHPHYCKITRVTGEDSFSDGTEIVIYEGACRKYHRGVGKTSSVSAGTRMSFVLSIPGIVAVQEGDHIEVSDRSGTTYNGTVVDPYICNLGTTVYWESGGR